MTLLLCLVLQAAQTDDVAIYAVRYARPDSSCTIQWKDGRGTITRKTVKDDKTAEWTGTFEKKDLDALLKTLSDAKAPDLKSMRCSKHCGMVDPGKHCPSRADFNVKGTKYALDTCPSDETKDNKPALAVINAVLAFGEKHATKEVQK